MKVKLYILFLLCSMCSATVAKDSIGDNDLTVSVCTATPADILYSCVGHAFIRTQCPKYGLDFCYSYESDDVKDRILSFFAGNLKMGMFCVKTKQYLEFYAQDHRGVTQYDLNLPLDVKRRMCQILDERVAQGANLPYDCLQRGCARSCIEVLDEALGEDTISFGTWPKKYKHTRREFIANYITNRPWTALALWIIEGTDCDKDCSNEEKIVIPSDLIEVLSHAKVDGLPLITSAPKTLVSGGEKVESPWFTPMMAAGLILLLVLIGWFMKVPYAEWLVMAIQTILGLFVTYLVCFSSLSGTTWNWLIVPFNPLPLLLWLVSRAHHWNWKRYWCPFYAVVLTLWIIAMLVYPHRLTDNAFILFAVSLIVVNLQEMNIKHIRKR